MHPMNEPTFNVFLGRLTWNLELWLPIVCVARTNPESLSEENFGPSHIYYCNPPPWGRQASPQFRLKSCSDFPVCLKVCPLYPYPTLRQRTEHQTYCQPILSRTHRKKQYWWRTARRTCYPFFSLTLNATFWVSQILRKNNWTIFASHTKVLTKLYFFTTLLTYIERCYEKQPRKLIIIYYYIFYMNGFEDIICYIALGFPLKTHRRNFSGLGSKNSCTSLNHCLALKLFHAMNLVYSHALETKQLIGILPWALYMLTLLRALSDLPYTHFLLTPISLLIFFFGSC